MPRESQEPHFRPKPLLTGKKQSRAGPEKQKMKCKWQMNRSETVQIQSHKIWSTALLETTTTLLLPWAEWTKPRRRSKTRARGTIVPICTKETYRIYTMLSSSSFSPNKENVRSMENTKFNIYHSIIYKNLQILTDLKTEVHLAILTPFYWLLLFNCVAMTRDWIAKNKNEKPQSFRVSPFDINFDFAVLKRLNFATF